ncbi:MAG: radical SAM family heme chaperone HemW, partial [Clostridia bacterium]|nr:radical SAM family heme chaperone HemW [Clostridia bacterium]
MMITDQKTAALPQGTPKSGEAVAEKATVGLYLHIPFCLRKCAYCDFYSTPADKDTREALLTALLAQLVAFSPVARAREVDTVYIGGGTPTLLDGEQFLRILDTVRAYYTLSPTAEITAECNPATHERGYLKALFGAGINRLSIGLQSIHEDELQALGRLHDFDDFLRTVEDAQSAGIDNISADVMYGIPGQTPASFERTLQAILPLGLSHLSAYSLILEEGTPLFERQGTLTLPSEDEILEMEQIADTLLGKAGFFHYEISNYAKDGMTSKHNLRYWRYLDYLGFGPAAHSFFDGWRFEAPRSTAAFLAAANEKRFDTLATARKKICGKEAMDEYVMLGMRLFEGLDLADFSHRFGTSFEKTYGPLDTLVSRGLLVNDKRRVAFTRSGMNL